MPNNNKLGIKSTEFVCETAQYTKQQSYQRPYSYIKNLKEIHQGKCMCIRNIFLNNHAPCAYKVYAVDVTATTMLVFLNKRILIMFLF